VNGVLKANKTGFHSASSYPMKLFVGSGGVYGDSYCSSSRIQAQQYLGDLDELRVYNAELTQNDVCALFAL
jgi:hypothetical protein